MSAKTERLVNLTVALLAARRPLTFAELRARMGEWQDGDPDSMRRKFERDKDELRRLGVPVDTVPLDELSGELGYHVDRARYEQPDVALTVDQVTVLALALQLVDGDVAPLAWAKLAARAPDPVAGEVPAGLRVTVDADAATPLASAVVERRTVRFGYRDVAGERTERTVEPGAVVVRGGAWYLVGHDRDRDALRAFRLDRVDGRVVTTGEPARPLPDDADLAALVDGPVSTTTTVEVRDPDGTTTQRTGPRRRLVDELLRQAPRSVPLAPPDVVDEVAEGLAAVLAAHGGAS